MGDRHIPEPLLGKGLIVIAPDYRLSPKAKAPAYIEDAAAAVAWAFLHAAEYGGDSGRIFVGGASAGAYLAAMATLDKKWLASHDIDANRIAGLICMTGQMITHFTVRAERGIPEHQPVIDEMAPLYHVRADAPPVLLTTGDRGLELPGRYEENAYFARMMNAAGHHNTTLHEIKAADHGAVEMASHPIMIDFISKIRAAIRP